ncbi:MAG: FlgD immunoglobulin-like domain containing protein, partial [Phycisphaerae bacterium]
GQLQTQNWVTNGITQIGPKSVGTLSTTTPTAITYTGLSLQSGGVDEVRISDVALTPAQVARNFENYRATQTTWFASPTGVSTNAGTRISPLDLTTALTHATADNKIVLLAGTYDGSQFRVTTSGNSPLHRVLITGDDFTAGTAGQAIIQTTGSTQGALISNSAQYITLRNLTFSTDQSAALAFSGAGYGNVIDGCRITSNAAGLTVTDSAGYTDSLLVNGNSVGSVGQHLFAVPGVTLQNSVVAPGTTGTAVSYVNSPVVALRNNTIVGGTIGASFTTATTNVSLLDNIFEAQTSAGLYFGSDSLSDGLVGTDGSRLPSYMGDGNIYHPVGSGFVATVVDGATTNNYSTLDSFAQFWYVYQYTTTSGGSPLKYWTSGEGIGLRSDQRSLQVAPTFVSSSDFTLAPNAGNYIDTGADRIFGRLAAGGYPTTWDARGAARTQGNAIDAGTYETAGPLSRTYTLGAAATTSAGVYDVNGKLIRTLWSGIKYPAGNVTAYWNGLDDSNVAVGNGNYTIKVLTSNVQYVWDGAMNNSVPLDGPTVNGSYNPIQSMVVVGTNAYYSAGYNEGRFQLYSFALSNPYQTTGYGGFGTGTFDTVQIWDPVVTSITADSTTLYVLYGSSGTANKPGGAMVPFIAAYDLNFNSLRTANVGTTTLTDPTGIAVQPTGYQNLVFVADAADNKVYLYDKTTFAAYSTPYLDGSGSGWNTPRSVAVTSTGDLWLTCKNSVTGLWQVLRYTGFGGTPTVAATITGLTNPTGIAVSTDGNNTLMVT